MRRRLRKKRHRTFLTFVCAHAITCDGNGIRSTLLQTSPGTPIRVDGRCHALIHRLMQVNRLRYSMAVVRRLDPATAVVAYWAEGFPEVRDTAVIFSLAELGIDLPTPQ